MRAAARTTFALAKEEEADDMFLLADGALAF
jgi:hypothetical protein